MHRSLEIEENAFVIENLQLAIGPSIKGTGAAATFSIPVHYGASDSASTEPPRPIEVQFERDATAKINTTWLKTHEHALPCWLIADFASEICDSLGPDATFAGELDLTASAFGPGDQEVEVYLNGRVEDIDVSDNQIASHTGSPQSKRASMLLNHCEFVNGEPTKGAAALNVPHLCNQVLMAKESFHRSSKQIDVSNAINDAINKGYQRIAREGDDSMQR